MVAKSETFDEFFLRATGHAPFPYQERLAETESPRVFLNVPTGVGKTAAAFFAWLWQRRFAPEPIPRNTPRRLVYCLPMRVLVEQTRDCFERWLTKLCLADEVGLHVLMGGEDDDEWELSPEREAVLVGTQDMLLSRALNRGYGMSRYRWPMHFGLVNNDCRWIIDEVQLMGCGLATTAQLEAFRERFGTLGLVSTIWMSATLRRHWLKTVDFDPWRDAEIIELGEQDLAAQDPASKELRKRVVDAAKPLSQARNTADQPAKLAEEIVDAHRPASRTLVVVNTVKRAVELYAELKKRKLAARLVLLHSRFRPPDRKERVEALLTEPDTSGTIAVSTQVVEAGVDVSAKTLFTELAPWSSLVQRFGRCNRRGEDGDASVLWLNLPDGADARDMLRPYERDDLIAAREVLSRCTDARPSSLPKDAKMSLPLTQVIRRKDIIELFDTTPDLAGHDIDVSRFIRETSDLDVRVFWRSVDREAEPREEDQPHRDELCPAPVAEVRELIRKGRCVWTWDGLEESWRRIRRPDELYPGQTLMLSAEERNYTTQEGWGSRSNSPVAVLPHGNRENDADSRDPSSQTVWQLLADHTDQVVAKVASLAESLELPDCWCEALRAGARWHDVGKAHQVFQDSMRSKDADQAPAGLLAKCPHNFHHKRRGFRHELASGVLALMHGQNDLVAYLAASHHGKVRLSIRSLPTELPPDGDGSRRFARGIYDRELIPSTGAAIDLGGGIVVAATQIDLSYMDLGGSDDRGASWLARTLALRNRPDLGPFRIAFLEAVIKAADERASGAIK